MFINFISANFLSNGRPHGPMVRRVTTNHEIAGSSPAVVKLSFFDQSGGNWRGMTWWDACFFEESSTVRVGILDGWCGIAHGR